MQDSSANVKGRIPCESATCDEKDNVDVPLCYVADRQLYLEILSEKMNATTCYSIVRHLRENSLSGRAGEKRATNSRRTLSRWQTVAPERVVSLSRNFPSPFTADCDYE